MKAVSDKEIIHAQKPIGIEPVDAALRLAGIEREIAQRPELKDAVCDRLSPWSAAELGYELDSGEALEDFIAPKLRGIVWSVAVEIASPDFLDGHTSESTMAAVKAATIGTVKAEEGAVADDFELETVRMEAVHLLGEELYSWLLSEHK